MPRVQVVFHNERCHWGFWGGGGGGMPHLVAALCHACLTDRAAGQQSHAALHFGHDRSAAVLACLCCRVHLGSTALEALVAGWRAHTPLGVVAGPPLHRSER